MKKILLLLLLYLTSLATFSQAPTTKIVKAEIQTLDTGKYVFTQTVTFTEARPAGAKYAKYTFQYSIIKSTTVIIHSSDDEYIYFKKDPASSLETFAAKKSDFFFYTKQIFQKFKGAEAGLYTIPFRVRGSGDDFDFETNLSLQANIVFGFGSRKSQTSWFDASVGIGLSSIALNAKNSKVTENRTASALTLSIGGVFKPNSRANIGLFLGGDFLGRSDKSVDWKYDRNLWLGVGVNISFNKVETDKPATNASYSDQRDNEEATNKLANATKLKIQSLTAELATKTKASVASETQKVQNELDEITKEQAFVDSEVLRIKNDKKKFWRWLFNN